MDNLICRVEECKYNHANGCTAKEITVGTCASQMKAACCSDTACEKFERRDG